MDIFKDKKKLFTFFAIAMIALCGAFILSSEHTQDSAAIGEDLSATYGTPTNISLAPGYSWTYTPTYPADLASYVTTSLQVNDSSIGSVSSGVVTVLVPSNATVGTVYNIVIKAYMSSPVEQTAYQYVKITVTSGLSITAGQDIADIVKGTAITSLTPAATSSMGTITWAVKSGQSLPAGLTLSSGVVSGTPTVAGTNTVYLTASCSGQTADLTVSFVVYNVIVGGSAQTISSYNTTVSSTTITQTGSDLGVTWAVTSGTMPAGFSLNASTGVISGSSAVVKSTAITITGTTANGPTQTTTKVITVRSESTLTLSGGADITTFKNNATAKTSAITAGATTSTIAWTITAYSGVTVSAAGVVSIVNSTTANMAGSVTVTATTAYGQVVTKVVNLHVEDTLTISGNTTLSAIAGTAKSTTAFTVVGGSGNTLAASTGAVGLNQAIVSGALQINSASPTTGNTVTVTVTSAAGQTATATITVNVYNVLTFSSSPSGGIVAYAV